MKRWLPAILLLLIPTGTAFAWELALPDSVRVAGPNVRLGDLVGGPMPTAAKDLVVQSGRRPGTCETLSRRSLLRLLVTNGLAGGVRLSGASACNVLVEGSEIVATELTGRIRAALQGCISPQPAGAPAPWLELDVPDLPVHLTGDPRIAVKKERDLQPGRNQVRVTIASADRTQDVPVGVVLHAYGEVPTARRAIARDVALKPDLFDWEWRDLAEESGELVQGRDAVLGTSSARELAAGQMLRPDHCKATPLVEIGDSVELTILRGAVTASVRAFARQAGTLGQTIPVRNELTGRLVNARVTGPGLVEWRR